MWYDLGIVNHNNMINMNHSFWKYQTLKREMTNITVNGNIYCDRVDKTM